MNDFFYSNLKEGQGMKLIICKDYDEASLKASEIVINQIKNKPNSVIGLATGSTPVGLYKKLIEAFNNGEISFKQVSTFNLDEYLGISHDHPESYHAFMRENLFKYVDILEKNIHIPCSDLKNADENVLKYTKALQKVQVDIQLLGIGTNGHIGFNEPGSSFDNETFAVALTEQTRHDNLRFFNSIEEVPTHAVTMGIKTIYRSKKIILMATGLTKADAIYGMLKGPITPDLPASALRNHPDLVVIIDELAASKL